MFASLQDGTTVDAGAIGFPSALAGPQKTLLLRRCAVVRLIALSPAHPTEKAALTEWIGNPIGGRPATTCLAEQDAAG